MNRLPQMALCGPYQQICFPGFNSFFKPDWNPRPQMLAKFKSYFEGFAAHGRQIYIRREKIQAAFLKRGVSVSLRTIDRYLAWLTKSGWMETVKRTARTAIREVKKVFAPQRSGESNGESIEVTPERNPKPDKKERSLPERVSKALENAKNRIRRARNPEAYRQTIISSTLRVMKWESTTRFYPSTEAKTEAAPMKSCEEAFWGFVCDQH